MLSSSTLQAASYNVMVMTSPPARPRYVSAARSSKARSSHERLFFVLSFAAVAVLLGSVAGVLVWLGIRTLRLLVRLLATL